MKPHYLTEMRVLVGSIISALNSLLIKTAWHMPSHIGAYVLTEEFKEGNFRTFGGVGRYRHRNETVIIKQHRFLLPDLDYHYLKNEAGVLRLLSGLIPSLRCGKYALVPVVIDFMQTKTTLSLIMANAPGVKLTGCSDRTKINVWHRCLSTMREISKKIPAVQLTAVPRREPVDYAYLLLINGIKAIIKEPAKTRVYLRMIAVCFTHLLFGFIHQNRGKVLAHRDLSSNNILYDKKTDTVTMVDWENAVLTDPLFDVAHIARSASAELKPTALISLISPHITGRLDAHRFLALTIFDAFQTIAVNRTDKPWYRAAQRYLTTVTCVIRPSILPPLSLYERVNSATLSFIAWLIRRVPTASDIRLASAVLCYHSVSDDGWRFATTPADFEEQINTLKASIVPISCLAGDPPKPGIAISFDDGYEDTYTNAYPILKKHGLTACVFVLGEPDRVDRSQLKNNNRFLTISQIQALHKAGWEIGFHTRSHQDPRDLSDAELDNEIGIAKRKLEKQLGFSLRYFAYPRGLYTPQIVNAVKRAGFTAAFTIEGARKRKEQPLLLSRLPVEGNLSMRQFSALISPIGQELTGLFIRILETKETMQHTFFGRLNQKETVDNHRVVRYNTIS